MRNNSKFVSSQRGAGVIKFILLMGVLAAMGVAATNFVPVYVTDQSVRHSMKEVARKAAMRKKTDLQIQQELLSRHKDYWVQLPDDTQYSVRQRNKNVEIEVEATIPVYLIFTTYNYRINYKAVDHDL